MDKEEPPLRNSRLARHLVRRLRRDCEIAWPGGEGNAAIKTARAKRRWHLVTLDGQRGPRISGPTPLSQLLSDGFVAVNWGMRGDIELYPAETALEELSEASGLA